MVVTIFDGGGAGWAMWTPQGYYAASDQGGRMIGWLINDGLENQPRLVRAAELSELARPDIVENAVLLRSALAAVASAARADPGMKNALGRRLRDFAKIPSN